MVLIAILVGCIIGAILGLNSPLIPYSVSGYLAIGIMAALDSVFGGIKSVVQKNFDMKVFVSGFFINSITAVLLTYLGNKLNVDISLAAIIVFVGRIFIDLAIIRRYYIEKWTNWMEKKQKEKSLEKDLALLYSGLRLQPKNIYELMNETGFLLKKA